MKIYNGFVEMEPVRGIAPPIGDAIVVSEESGTRVSIPLSVIIRCYEIAKYECERAKRNWDADCERIINGA